MLFTTVRCAMSQSESAPSLLTLGRMSELLKTPRHRVAYVLRTRHHIRPTAMAGRVRLYNRASLAQVRHSLNAIDARKGGRADDE